MMIGIGTPSNQSKTERPMTDLRVGGVSPARQMAGVKIFITVATTHAGAPPGGRGAEDHRGGGQECEKDPGFARGFGCRPLFLGPTLILAEIASTRFSASADLRPARADTMRAR